MYKTYREVSKLLRRHGCTLIRKSKHIVWYSPITRRNFTVPHGGVKDKGSLPQHPQTGGDRGRRRPLNLTEADVFHLKEIVDPVF